MSETKRTQITLQEFTMDLIDDYIGILGASRSQVIEYIVIEYFKEGAKNIENLKKLREKKVKKLTIKRNKKDFEENIKIFFQRTESISIENFIEYLNITKEIFWEFYIEWADKFQFKVENDRIVKIRE
ncbi:MAG: hypothetical protein ACOC1X_04260 [Promethearchaeota archaeon]